MTYVRPLSDEDVALIMKQGAGAVGWKYITEEWWYGPKIVARSKSHDLTYICGGWSLDEDGDEQHLWLTPEEFRKPILRMNDPDFDLDDMELAEILMEEMK